MTRADDALECVKSGVLAVGRDTTVEIYNQAAANMLGVPSSRVIGRSLASLEGEGGPLGQLARTLRTEGMEGRRSPRRRQIDVETGAGRRSLGYSLCVADASPAAVMVFSDLTRRSEIERRAAEDHVLAGVGRVAVAVAHDLKSPLAAIDLHAAHAAHNGDPDSRHLIAIARAVDECFSLLAAIREEIGADATVRLCDAGEVARRFADEHCEDPELPLIVDISLGRAPVMLSEHELTSVLTNLVGNAVDSSSNGDPVELRCVSADGWLDLRVLDSGAGLPEGDVFQLFYSTKSRGAGMGLWLARRLVERAGGRIAAHERSPGGVEMVVTLPYAEHSRLQSCRFLVVDEGIQAPAGIVAALQRSGAETVVAASAKEVSDLAAKGEDCDCAIFDYLVPGRGDHHLALMAPPDARVLTNGDDQAMAALVAMQRGSLRLMSRPHTTQEVLDAASIVIPQAQRA